MRSKVETHADEAEKRVRDIRWATRRQFSAEEKVRIAIVRRHQPPAAPAPDSQHPIAIEFDFVLPIRTLWQLRDRKALHRFDESSSLFCTAL